MSIGSTLQLAREQGNLSIEEAAWRTRIRPEYLRALESGRYEDLGKAVFVRGHLLSYARFLSLDPSDILEAYEREFEDGTPSPLEELDRRVRVARKPQRPRWLLAAALASAVLAVVGAVGLLHGPGERTSAVDVLPTLPRLNEPAPASRSNAVADALADRVPLQASTVPIHLTLSVTGRCWVEVVADGETILAEVLGAGSVKDLTAVRTLKVTLGNAAAATLSFNGVPVALAPSGVWTATFGPSGLTSQG